MSKLILIIAILGAISMATRHPINMEIYEELMKIKDLPWSPMHPDDNPLAFIPADDLRKISGEIPIEDFIPYHFPQEDFNRPEAFDAREQWKGCVHPVMNQRRCGGCWAFAVSQAVSDRYCIAGKDLKLSPQNLIDCDEWNFGCSGGNIYTACLHIEEHGLTTDTC